MKKKKRFGEGFWQRGGRRGGGCNGASPLGLKVRGDYVERLEKGSPEASPENASRR